MAKTCDNCKHEKLEHNEGPCRDCLCHNHWEAKSEIVISDDGMEIKVNGETIAHFEAGSSYVNLSSTNGESLKGICNHDITQMWPDTIFNKEAVEYYDKDVKLTEQLYKQMLNTRYGAYGQYGIEGRERMADWKVLRDECEKMAERYGLSLEVDYDSLRDILTSTFRSPGRNRKSSVYKTFNVCMRDPRKVLEDIERGLIRRFDIDLNKYEPVKVPRIERVIHNNPATIVFWADGTKTVVKCQDGDIYDPEKGLAMAISKKALGNQGNYCEVFKKWLPEEEENVGEFEFTFEPIDVSKILGEIKFGNPVSLSVKKGE